jgi:hypothetical protein
MVEEASIVQLSHVHTYIGRKGAKLSPLSVSQLVTSQTFNTQEMKQWRCATLARFKRCSIGNAWQGVKKAQVTLLEIVVCVTIDIYLWSQTLISTDADICSTVH